MARPTKYFDSFTKVAEKKVLLSYKKGGSDVKAAVILGIHRDTLYEWLKDKNKPEFSDTIKFGRCLSQVFDEAKLDKSVNNKDLNPNPLFFKMKNRYKADYGEQQQQITTNVYQDVGVPKRQSEDEWKKSLEKEGK